MDVALRQNSRRPEALPVTSILMLLPGMKKLIGSLILVPCGFASASALHPSSFFYRTSPAGPPIEDRAGLLRGATSVPIRSAAK
jgi:hypothetical protein